MIVKNAWSGVFVKEKDEIGMHGCEHWAVEAVLGNAIGGQAEGVVGKPVGVVGKAADVPDEERVIDGEGGKPLPQVEVGACDVFGVLEQIPEVDGRIGE